MSSPKMDKDIITLQATINTTLGLISQFQAAAKPSSTTYSKPEDHTTGALEALAANISLEKKQTAGSVNVLDLTHDAASLIRAHSTKISLLTINEPYTPTAICTVLRELSSGPLPGLASALELCDETRYTKLLKKELTFAVDNAFNKLSLLVQEIPLNGKALKKGGKGTLASIGVVWEACDELMTLGNMGIAGLVVKKAQNYRDILKDALEELKEWGDEESDDDEEEEGDGGVQDDVDNIFANMQHIPPDDPNKIRDRLDSSLKRLKTILIMYSAVIKRRFKTLPSLPRPETPPNSVSNGNTDIEVPITQTLDEVIEVLRKIPNSVDELAGAFYELDVKEIDKRMDECFFLGWSAVEMLVKNWQGEKDEFSDWAQKFREMMKKGGS